MLGCDYENVLQIWTIVSVVTTYFMRPLNRPKRKIEDSIVAGLEQFDDLTDDEKNLLESEISWLFKQIKDVSSAPLTIGKQNHPASRTEARFNNLI